ncbi:MAG: toprim domain-containing protein, partial [Chloroflexi bacterium]|nr:toprim domain-containing protein [Chloroflexota bacterium]
DYVKGRGFILTREDGEDTPATALLARLGYSGAGSEAQRSEMSEALRLNGVDLESPVALAILGYHGDVAGWARARQIEVSDDWAKYKHIPGLLDHPRLCYPHVEHGQVRYISTRSIGEKFHYNLPECLVGKRRMYFNHQWGATNTQVVVCEGQADAITWGQWSIPAVALAGVTPDEDLGELLKPYQAVYIAMDMDITGITAAWRLALSLGPRVRLVPPRDPGCVLLSLPPDAQPRVKEFYELANQVLTAASAIMRWPLSKQYETFTSGAEEKEVKDSNDILRTFTSRGLAEAEQIQHAQLLLDRSPAASEMVSSWAGARDGSARDAAMKTAAGLINRLDEFSLAQQKNRLAKLLQVSVRDLNNMLKAEKVQSKKSSHGGEPIYTWGGYVDGWLLEYLYNAAEHTSSLAWRDPDGKIDCGPGVSIDGNWYEAFPPDDNFKGNLYYPSELGEKKSIRELIIYLRMYLNSVYIMPSDEMTRLVAYWILQTYLFDAFQSTIYLRALGDTGSGKSEFITRVGIACYRMMMASGMDSVSSLFRSVDRYHGTVIIDEADIQMSDTESDMIKFYNQGAFKGRPVMRVKEMIGPDGEKTWEPVTFQVFCPKLIGVRKEFRDDAVGTRSLTLKLVAKEPAELIAAKVPLVIDREMLERSQALRNLLVRYRLENWQPEIPINPDWYDLTISARLNQVAGPLLAIAKDDPDQQEEIRQVLRDYYAETILNRSMTKGARVLEAMWKIWNYPDLHKDMVKPDEEGNQLIRNADITRITNEIMDEMNETGSEESHEDDPAWKKNRKELTPNTVARIIRDDFQIRMSNRKRDGFWVYWNEPRMVGLSFKYGIIPADFGPQSGRPSSSTPVQPKQEKLELP